MATSRTSPRTAAPLALVALAALASCATLADAGKGDVDLPNVLSGPFRSLKHGRTCFEDPTTSELSCVGVDELPEGTQNGVPRYPGLPPSRSPSVLVRGAMHVVLYVARGKEGAPTDRLARLESKDARKFDDVVDVLPLDRPDEGASIGDPWAMDDGGRVVLYYSSPTGGIFRARATDGLAGNAFAKDGPVTLTGAKDARETDPPRALSVVAFGGVYRLFYASGGHLFEAEGTDGLTFARRGVVLSPSASVDPTTLPSGVRPPFDDAALDDPCVDRTITPAGRVLYRLLFTGRDKAGGSSIGYAGRFGDAGAFEKAAGFVYGGKLPGGLTTNSHANAPAVARFDGFALLFANRDTGESSQRLGIAVSPQTLFLPYGNE